MWAIKRSGGSCILQNHNEAEYPDMPLSVINNMEFDHVLSLQEIGGPGKNDRAKKEKKEDPCSQQKLQVQRFGWH
ncbi:MAG: chemotaxis protein CheB [Ferruginibacter sp.]